MASKKQNTLLNFFKHKEKQDDPMSIDKNTDNPLLMCEQSPKVNYLYNTFSYINAPTNDPDDPMSIDKITDYPDASLLMSDQSPKVNDLNNTLDNTIEKESDLNNSNIGPWFMF
ncbi:uncharacterized protein LOC132948805 isoform X2 [Metopolophium dirhodum]|uniref:uncharacterized protein LOC132936481 n=1 Tax=Metopolophium dirhodum TaxID=44670 RepID=UPI0029901343|nr:uncharacterized protein LOC132936481 [Metopolophium dirhodum]XP_060859534.1 uncharacterized protein LOC132936786 [Metopolophium dirhodum]XP_060875437.1 uncharacterized protein LOC132948805 isoform X2 [Metopolophium dirhodum]